MATTEEWFETKLKDLKRPASMSSIDNGLRCARLYLLRNKWGLRPKVREYSKSASLGKLIHRLQKAGRDGTDIVKQEVIKQHGKLVERIKAGGDLTGDLARAAKEIGEIHQKALAVCHLYWNRFPPKEYMKTICREEKVTGSHTCMGIDLPLMGIFDWMVEDKRDGKLWIRDTKSTGRKFASILTGFLYCTQCRFYHLLGEQNPKWKGRVQGFILDMVKTPGIKLCGKDDKMAAALGCSPFEAYVQRVKEWYEAQQEDSMRSSAIPFSEPVYNEEIKGALVRIAKLWKGDPYPYLYPKDLTRSKCYEYERECVYYPLCCSDEAAWPSIIDAFYVIPEPEKETKNE